MWPDWAIWWTLGNFLRPLATINLPKSPTFLGNFCKGVKIINFSSEIILGNFDRHLAIFYWSHCSHLTEVMSKTSDFAKKKCQTFNYYHFAKWHLQNALFLGIRDPSKTKAGAQSSGYGWCLMYVRYMRARIPAPYTAWTFGHFFTLIIKMVLFVWKDRKLT